MKELEAKGIRPGPESFGSWNDGDAGLVRAIWCFTCHLRPKNVVETGVAHGVTSRFILEALEKNGSGHLSSIDLPPIERFWQRKSEWRSAAATQIDGRTSRAQAGFTFPSCFPGLARSIFLFTTACTASETCASSSIEPGHIRPGGALIVDDVDANWGFRSFTQTFPGHRSMVCEAEPVRPDPRRFNKKGLFGIILKEPTEPV